MKKIYIFLFAIMSCFQLFAQDFCADADSNLIYAYSNVKDAYDSDNLDHLKYYSRKSLESFEKAKINLKQCGCEKAYNLTYDSYELLKKVEDQDTFEDGRFFVKRAREITQNSITALNEFVANHAENEFLGDDDLVSESTDANDTNEELSALQQEQERLEQQRLELEAKKKEIAQKLAKQKEMASKLEKETLINKYEEALFLNIETYNELLKTYGSTSKVKSSSTGKKDLMNKSIIEIKAFYIDNIKQVTNSYLAELNDI